jgi:outer membrane protein assembly factor BamB
VFSPSPWFGDSGTSWVARIDPQGKTRWHVELGGRSGPSDIGSFSGLATDPQCNVVVELNVDAFGDDRFVALAAADGAIKWTKSALETLGFGPRFLDDAVVVKGSDERGLTLTAWDPHTGAQRWQQVVAAASDFPDASFPLTYRSTPIQSSGSAWAVTFSWSQAPSSRAAVRLISPVDGSIVATRSFDQPLSASASRAGGGWILAVGPQVLGLDGTLATRWARSMAGQIKAVAGLPDGGALVSVDDGADGILSRLAGTGGVTLWESGEPGDPSRIVVSPDGLHAAVGDNGYSNGYERIVDVGSGLRPRDATVQVPVGLTGSAILAEEGIVVDVGVAASRWGGLLVARGIARQSGEVLWSRQLDFGDLSDDAVTGSAHAVALGDGTVLVTGYTSRPAPSGFVPFGSTYTSSVLARLRVFDGFVQERTDPREGTAVTSFVATEDRAVYATRLRTAEVDGFAVTRRFVDRLDGISTRWRRSYVFNFNDSLQIAATHAGVLVFATAEPTASRLQALAPDDGSLRWAAPRVIGSFAPHAVTSDGADRAMLVYGTNVPGGLRDVTVERVDMANGTALWTRALDAIPGGLDSLAGSVAFDATGFALAWSTRPSFSVPARVASARFTDAGDLTWMTLLEAPSPGWGLEPRGLLHDGSGGFMLLTASFFGTAAYFPDYLGTAAMMHLSPEGAVTATRTLRAVAESNAVSGLHARRAMAAEGTNAVLDVMRTADKTTRATAMVALGAVAAGTPTIALTVTAMPATVRRARVVIDAQVPTVPIGTEGAITVAMPPGLVAGTVSCVASGDAVCGTAQGGTSVVLPMEVHGAGALRIEFDATAPTGPTLTGPIVAMIDVDHPFATPHLRDRVATASVTFAPLQDPVFQDGFE